MAMSTIPAICSQMDAGIAATPMTYEADGRQFVVQVTGRHMFFDAPPGDAIVAFSLRGP